WSLPSSIASKEYTNLSEGKYVFEVKAFVNGSADSTNTASVSFMIFPPWYRSSLAYIFYFLIIIIFLFVLYKKTISKQKKIIYQKGEELIAQTKRYEEETKLKDQEIYELQNENLKTELRYKTQELSGYMLNVIRKNEILEDVKKNALSISKSIDEEKEVNIIKQKVVRLISQINSNIEHDTDFEVFKSNFDLVHQDFFRLLDERFPGLSRNDKILCAYLYMNLSTKEIAPLLNISTRGVEVNRYRLRKKMNLDRDINLSEYLQNLK
ncbi:MAG: LuxR family transcriptional regulator, partial [Prevotella sp.]|nr:LuxR family transcriptional regulator [Prevotella sp.]